MIAGGAGTKTTKPLTGRNNNVNVPAFLWKVVIDLPRAGADLSEADAFAVWMPNDAISGSWTPYRISIGQLKTQLASFGRSDYNFLSTLPQDLRVSLENKNNGVPLLADPSFIPNTAVGHRDIAVMNSSQLDARQVSIHQVDINQVSALPNGIAQISTSQIEPHQVSRSQVGVTQVHSAQIPTQGAAHQARASQVDSSAISSIQLGISQVGLTEISITQVSKVQTGSTQRGTTQVSSTQVSSDHGMLANQGTTQVSSTQISSIQFPTTSQVSIPKVNATQVGSNQNATFFPQPDPFIAGVVGGNTQLNFGEISFSSSIALQQFLSGNDFSVNDSIFHSLTLQSIAALKNSAGTLWNPLLTLPISSTVNLIFQDLPVGQLAEAKITEFDRQGRPIAGTLTLDINGNGLGWYIDPTPEDNSEYSQALTSTAFKATPGSSA